MKKSFLWGLVALMLFSFFVISCQKEDSPLKEEKNTEIKEETPEKEEENSSSSENSNEGNNGGSNDNSNGSNQGGDSDNSDQNNNQSGNNNSTDNNQADNNVAFVSKVLVEDVTGTWCGYCPIATRSIQTAKNTQTPLKERFVVVAIHNRGGRRNEPMEIQKSYPLLSLFKILPNLNFKGFPFLVMNRDQQLPRGYTWVHIFERLEKTAPSPLGIKISSKLNATGGSVSVSFKTTENLEGLKYHIFVTQDHLIYGQSDVIEKYDPNFKHDEVLRDIYGEVTGNALGTLTKGQEVTKENQQVSYKLLQHTDLDKVKVVVFVTNAAGAVVNVQEAKANQTKDYQYAK
ncbi:Omp28-related outer membrane protein [Capnocytophaga canimorsus]|uniref:Omp28-related outer membrane protein n=1 Tax=Capnocytophaga canimorsus TaxID=28188 RepID=UPI00385A54A2